MPSETAAPVYELPFYLVCMLRPFYKIFNPSLDQKWDKLIAAEKNNTLRDMYPKYERPIASQFVNKQMIENSLWAEADAEGNLATSDPELAAYALHAAQKLNPKAGLHQYSKQLTQDEINGVQSKIPVPQVYNLKPKNQLNVKK